jgi:hypothetical protein
VLPAVVWSAYSTLVQHGTSARAFHVHLRTLRPALDDTSGWLVPSSWPSGLRAAIVLLAAGLIVAMFIRSRRDKDAATNTLRTLAVFWVTYLGVVVITRYFFDASTNFENRLLAPVQPLFYILLVAAVLRLMPASARAATFAGIGLCIALALSGVTPFWRELRDGFEPPSSSSQVFAAAAALPPGTLIASNAPDTMYAITGRSSIRVPSRQIPLTLSNDPDFADDIDDLVDLVDREHGVVVFASGRDAYVAGALQLATPADFDGRLRVVQRFPDGSLMLGPR